MKIFSKGSAVEIFGAETEEQTFQIQTSAIAFETLSARLYADRITAILRELACNARDAHSTNGNKKRPFEINLPTQLNSEFIIRDFGPGMSDDQILELYCTYFASSKQNSNKQIGGFGIGSKSPFSYTDGFTVISRQLQEKRTYSVYVNEDKIPAVVRMSTEPTDEEDGLEVRFPVNQKDIWEFEQKAKNVFEFFEPLPKINRPDFQPRKQKYKMEGKTWKMREYNNGVSGLRVIMDVVPYAVSGMDDLELTSEEQAVLNMNMDVFVPVGTLSPAATRESLTNDKQTVEKLRKIIQQVHEEITATFEDKLKTLDGGWDKLDFLKTFDSTPFSSIANEYRQKTIKDTSVFAKPDILQSDFKNLIVRQYRGLYYKKCDVTEIFGKGGNSKISLLAQYGFHCNPVEFIVDDRTSGSDLRLRQYVYNWPHEKKGNNSTVVFISPANPNAKATEFDKATYDAEVTALLAALGNPPFKLFTLAGLPEPPAKSITVKAEKAKVKSVTYNWDYRNFSNCWDRTEDEVPTTGTCYYVRAMFGKVVGLDKWTDGRKQKKWLEHVASLPFVAWDKTEPLYAFTEKQQLPKSGATWVDLVQHMREKMEAHLLVTEYLEPGDRGMLGETCGCDDLAVDTWFKRLPDSLMKEACDMYRNPSTQTGQEVRETMQRVLGDMEETSLLAMLLDKSVKKDTKFHEMAKKLKKRYPLLQGADVWRSQALAIFYVSTVEAEHSLVTGEMK